VIGTEISQYRLIEKLGEGGMGVVYKAVDTMLDRVVAIKLLSSQLAGNNELLERFKAEARMQATLSHPNIATLYAFLVWEGRAVMVMELIEGETLHQLTARRGQLPAEEAIPLFKQALAGVGAAHRRGIVHRDIKPANIMVNKESLVKVMDFGIAKVLGATGMTRTNMYMGTASYMAPEQVLNRPVDARTDIYALGVTLYEILSGQVPFRADSDYEVLSAHVQLKPVLPTEHCPNIPQQCVDAIMKALAKEPENRFATTDEFAAALDHGVSDSPGTASTIPAGTQGVQQECPGTPGRGSATVFVPPSGINFGRPAALAGPPSAIPVYPAPPVAKVEPPPAAGQQATGKRPSWLVPAAVLVFLVTLAAAGYAVYAMKERADREVQASHGSAAGSHGVDEDRRMQQEQEQSAEELKRQLAQEQTPPPPQQQIAKAGGGPSIPRSPVNPNRGVPGTLSPTNEPERLRALSGTWSGSYVCSQGTTGVTLQIVANSDQQIGALLQFAVPNSSPGSYFLRGAFNPSNNRLEMKFTKWKFQPQGYSAADFAGTVNFANRELRGVVLQSGCAAFSVRKQ
jgi:eukaryotic-like serine/threonine-protein kinase